jgi:hypothetical protein
MKAEAPCDFRHIVFLPGQKIAYARRGSDGKVFLQSAMIEEIDRTTVIDHEDKDVICLDSLVVRKPDGKKQRLHRFDGIAVIEKER